MAFLSKAQLESRTWPTRTALVSELQRNGYKPVGDYEPVEHKPDSWMIASVFKTDAEPPEPKHRVAKAAAKAAPAKKAEAPAKKAAAKAAPVCSACEKPLSAENITAGTKLCDECAGRKSNTTQPVTVQQLPERPARGVKKSAQKKAADEAKAKAAKPTPAPTPTPAEPEPVNDMTATPAADGPYTLRIGGLTAFNVPEQALAVARRLAPEFFLVSIIDKAGKVVRTIDGRIGAPKAAKRARSSDDGDARPRSQGRSTTPSAILQQAIKLAMRPEGVTRAQIREHITDRPLAWTIMLKDAERFGYVYSTSDATDGKSRTVYHLKPVTKA
jgi:hypothetical protein